MMYGQVQTHLGTVTCPGVEWDILDCLLSACLVTYSRNVRKKKLPVKPVERDQQEVDGGIILKWVFKK